MNRVPLEQLMFPQLVTTLPTYYETRRFITVITTARHLSLSWLTPTTPSHLMFLTFILVLSSHLCLPVGPFSSGFLTTIYPYMLHEPSISSFIWSPDSYFLSSKPIRQSSSLCSFLQAPGSSSLWGLNTFLSTLSPRSYLNVTDQVLHPYKKNRKYILLNFTFLDSKGHDKRF